MTADAVYSRRPDHGRAFDPWRRNPYIPDLITGSPVS